MKVNVHAVNFTVDKKLVDFVQERMDKLEKYYDRVVSSDVFMKVEKTSEKENKIVEIKINVPGDDFLVKKQISIVLQPSFFLRYLNYSGKFPIILPNLSFALDIKALLRFLESILCQR